MKPIHVGLLGLGTVGGGTLTVLRRNQAEITRRAGRAILVKMAAVRDLSKALHGIPLDFGHDVNLKEIINQVVDELFLCSLSRKPTPDEKQAALAEIATASSPQEGYEDFLWTLLNTREFQFNH